MARIVQIIEARITTYPDSGQVTARITWVDEDGQTGTTVGEPDNLHMRALLERAAREGVRVT